MHGSRRLVLSSLLVTALAAPAGVAHAQRCVDAADMADNPGQDRYCGVPLITTRLDGSGLGGAAGFGYNDSCLGQNDDGSGPMLPIDAYFPAGLHFFTNTHHSLYVNTNGNITFSDSESTFTPSAFPVSSNPMIAPFWADVDIRRADGSCSESIGLTCSDCSPCEPFASNGVWWSFEEGRALFTWDEVGYYNCHDDRRMSFQLVLTAVTGSCAGAGDFDVEFRYNRCEWETGDASGGSGGFASASSSMPVPAQAGFDAGDMTNFVEIMNSRMDHQIARTLCEDSNVGMPGIWRFQIRSGGVICPDAGMPCTVDGQMGACAMGRTNCVGSGTECVQQVTPNAETCDNVDNDCNGAIDDAPDTQLCGGGFVCRSGTCVGNCFENACTGSLVCAASGVCVEPGCDPNPCPAGQRCTSGGACVGACDGVTCPFGQDCVEGRCIDACTGLSCTDCTTCRAGACVIRCDMGGSCAAGEECDAGGNCVPAGCGATSCPGGQHCEAGGTCVDSCAGVMCPSAQECIAGSCVPVTGADAGMFMRPDTGIVLPDVGAGFDGGTGDTDGGHGPRRTPSACGCTTQAPTGSPMAASIGLALGAVLVARRRRR